MFNFGIVFVGACYSLYERRLRMIDGRKLIAFKFPDGWQLMEV